MVGVGRQIVGWSRFGICVLWQLKKDMGAGGSPCVDEKGGQ